ncbi:AP-5 complex subunit beta-1, partial [Ananas comosus]
DHFLVSATSVAISVLGSPPLPSAAAPHLQSLAETLLAVANRPNHGPDRHTRAVACECLRELELAFPLLLSDVAGHLWALAQAERTHAAQSYLLLLASVARNIVRHSLLSSPSSILSTAAPLVPFAVPHFLFSDPSPVPSPSPPSDLNLREIRRVVAFLMDRPQSLTPPAAAELASALACIAAGLEPWVPAVAALLKVQFSGLLYSYDPILSHVVLMLYCRFSDAFAGGDELGIARRLASIAKESHQPLVFRLLVLHWLLGAPQLASSLGLLAPRFYPTVFDPLALKAKKLDALAHIACSLGTLEGKREEEESKRAQVVKLFEDGLVCVSAYKWLPPWSTETLVAFRALHKFLVGVSPHDADSCDSTLRLLMESTIFNTLKTMLVNLALEHRGLVPVIAYFIDRLLGCEAHQLAGELLLQTLDEHLLPKLEVGYQLSSYFPVFEKIAQNYTVPPHGLLELLTKQMVSLAEKHGPDTELKSWSQGSKVLGVCHVTIKHHHSSRIFLPLSRLLAFTCQFFPDLEVRDTARVYLRMLLCIPGKKLRHIMGSSEQPSGVSPSASLFQVPSPRPPQDLNKKLSSISSYIHLERVVPLLVQQSWLLALPNFNTQSNGSTSFVGIQDISSSPSL